MLTVERYGPGLESAWNAFLASTRNGTFLHDRRYMDYHADRFEDCSLILREDGEILALLPANRRGASVWSHQGLSYGGLLMPDALTLARAEAALAAVRDHLAAAGVTELIYKPVPRIFHRAPADEDLVALHRMGASVIRRDNLSVVETAQRIRPRKGRRYGASKAAKAGIAIARSNDWNGFWRLLEATLSDRHAARPVHSLDEIAMLAHRFPDNIALHVAQREGEMLGGTVIYETPLVARTQYIAAAPAGLEASALDLLFITLIEEVYAAKRYFDFGASLDGAGGINAGLLDQKEGFGARAVLQDTYRVAL
ncbi:GNAT family N-acetyltransferase [Dongia sp.]|uniref:GNAT family N-acetyltransferase n=1 Tax=Dongia sp. TaxID=1977262 RepID=UPI0037532B7B